MTVLDELSSAISAVAGRAAPAVVRIGRDGGRGAGAVIGAGLVLTSAHNLRGPTTTVTFGDGSVASGQLKGVDAEGDLAVIEVPTAATAAIDAVAWSSAPVGLGQSVFALSLLPAGGVRVTAGQVSATGVAFRGPRGRLIADGFEHTAVVGRGSSGGPLVDRTGGLVGVNTHRPGDGLYLALPGSDARRASVDALARGESPVRRRLGVALAPSHVARRLRAAVGLEARDGVLIREVGEDTPAAAAGLQRGDLIVAVAGTPVDSVDGFIAALDGAGPTVALTVVRGADEISVEVGFDA